MASGRTPEPSVRILDQAQEKSCMTMKKPSLRVARSDPRCWGFLGHTVHEEQASGNQRRIELMRSESEAPS
jgi:hypothetical protein